MTGSQVTIGGFLGFARFIVFFVFCVEEIVFFFFGVFDERFSAGLVETGLFFLPGAGAGVGYAGEDAEDEEEGEGEEEDYEEEADYEVFVHCWVIGWLIGSI